MDQQILFKVCRTIYQKFPEVNNSQPKIYPQGKSQHLLVFQGSAFAPDGKKIPRTVRVVINDNGDITKTTTSR
jgi:hypothetical protein